MKFLHFLHLRLIIKVEDIDHISKLTIFMKNGDRHNIKDYKVSSIAKAIKDITADDFCGLIQVESSKNEGIDDLWV